MIIELLDRQLLRLAAAVARRRGTDQDAEIASLTTLVVTIEGSVIGLVEVAGMRPEAAEVVARAYAAGWLDAVHRWTGETLADAVHERINALEEPTPRRVGASVALPMPVDPLGAAHGIVGMGGDDAT